jgi:DNA replication protein
MSFSGFSNDQLVGLPPEFFSQVLPAIRSPAELKVTLHLFYRLSRLRGRPRRLTWEQLLGDELLLRGLQQLSPLRPTSELLDEGLAQAVRRGTVLHLAQPADGRVINWYLINTAANRSWAAEHGAVADAPALAEAMTPTPPDIVKVYEQNIGLVTPLLLEELRDAGERYPAEWLIEAVREAVHANARSWRYIRKVLERWAADGRNNAAGDAGRPIDIDRYTGGEYGGLFRRGGDESDL